MTSTQRYDAARAAIAATGLRQREVAEYLGIDASKLSKSLSGVRRFTATELSRLSSLTGVPVHRLAARTTAHQPEGSKDDARKAGKTTVQQARSTRRRTIVNAAWPLFAAHGYQPVTVADIAAAAGMSPSAVHYYFPTKNEIFLATLDACSRQGVTRRAAAYTIADPVERLCALFEIQLDGTPESYREWATWAQFWSSSPAFADAHAATEIAYARWREELLPLVQDGIAAGVFRAADPDVMVTALTALIDGLGIRMLEGDLRPTDVRNVVAASIRGWIARSDSGGHGLATKNLPVHKAKEYESTV